MDCLYCGSSNAESKIIVTDKSSRNTLFFIVPFIVTILIFIILGIIAEVLLLSFFVGLIVAIIFGFIGSLISKIIPQKNKVVFICNDCGKITKVKK